MEASKIIRQTKYGWVDLSNLARNKNDTINWMESIGCDIDFKYYDIRSTITILEYVQKNYIKMYIRCIDSEYCMNTGDVLLGKLGVAVGKITKTFRYKTGDVVSDNMMIMSSYRDNGIKCYTYRCLNDNYEGHIREDHIRRGRGCPVCSGRVVMKGLNDIATTHPKIASLLWDINDGYNHSAFSTKKVYFKCPHCGERLYATIENVTIQGLSCPRCNDGFSYPEKFVYSFLQQVANLHKDNLLLSEFETQKIFDWSRNIQHINNRLSGDKKYDFYIPLTNAIIIETHGEQHYLENSFHRLNSSRTFEEELANDELKQHLALNNGILDSNYVQLDCRHSDVNYITSSITNSNLPALLDFKYEQIDWCECNKFATTGLVYEICDLWNSGMHVIKNIASKLKIDRHTVSKYLRRGEELGIVQDPPKRKNKTQQND